MPLSSAISNLVPIVGRIVAFGEEQPPDRLSAPLKVAALGLTIESGVLMAGAEASVGGGPTTKSISD
jgi:hypothetical protein